MQGYEDNKVKGIYDDAEGGGQHGKMLLSGKKYEVITVKVSGMYLWVEITRYDVIFFRDVGR